MQSLQDQTAMQNGLPTNNAQLNVTINTQPGRGVSQEYAVKGVKMLSGLQITLGFLAIMFQIWDIINSSEVSSLGTGIWTGVLFIIAGSLGVHSSKNKKICVIISFLVMSIIASAFAAVLLAFSAIGVADADRTKYYYIKHQYTYGFQSDESHIDMVLAICTILLLISLAAGVVAIVSSGYACHGLCCSSKSEQGNVLIQGQVQYINSTTGQNQMVLIPMPNVPNVMSSSSPYQLTSSVGVFQNQPLPSPQGEIPTVQAEAASQAPTYLGQTDPPPVYEENDQHPLHKTY